MIGRTGSQPYPRPFLRTPELYLDLFKAVREDYPTCTTDEFFKICSDLMDLFEEHETYERHGEGD